jgi:hypothetical protein
MQDLGVLPADESQTRAYDINDSVQVVGTWLYSVPTKTESSAFIWTAAEGLIDLNTVLDSSGLGWAIIDGRAINNLGQIVGSGRNPGGEVHAVLLTPVPESPAAQGLIIGGLILASPMLRRRRRAQVANAAVTDCCPTVPSVR